MSHVFEQSCLPKLIPVQIRKILQNFTRYITRENLKKIQKSEMKIARFTDLPVS